MFAVSSVLMSTMRPPKAVAADFVLTTRNIRAESRRRPVVFKWEWTYGNEEGEMPITVTSWKVNCALRNWTKDSTNTRLALIETSMAWKDYARRELQQID